MSISKKVQKHAEKIRKDALTEIELKDLIHLLQELYEEKDSVWLEKSKKHFFDSYADEDEIYDQL